MHDNLLAKTLTKLAFEAFRREPNSKRGNVMAVGLSYSDWLLHDGEIRRRLIYEEPKTGQKVAAIHFACRVDPAECAQCFL
jgi:hypothetical protein